MSHERWFRWGRRLLAVVATLLMLGALIIPPGARADGLVDDLCKEVPKPVPPNWSVPGFVVFQPDLATVPDTAPDPFAPGSKIRISDVYGWSAHYTLYDLGCGNSFLSDPGAVIGTNMANSNLQSEQMNLALLAGAEDVVKSDQLTSWLGTTLETLASSIRPLLYGSDGRPGWLGLGVLAVAIMIGWAARRMAYSAVMGAVGAVTVAIVLVVFSLNLPTVMNRWLDSGVTAVANVTTAQLGNASPSDLIARESTYRTWLAGYFGSPDSTLAREQGPKLWASIHYSYSDMKAIARDPAARAKIDQVKSAAFKDVAQKIKDSDPAVYEKFTGRTDRSNPAMWGALMSWFMSVFHWFAFALLGVARLMMPALVVAAPFLAIVGMLQMRSGYTSLWRVWDMFTAAILVTVKFSVAAAVMTAAMNAIQQSEQLNPTWKVFLLITLTIVGLLVTKPIRSFKTMVPGMDPNSGLLGGGGLMQGLGKLGTIFLAAKMGAGSNDDSKPSDDDPGPEPIPTPQEQQDDHLALPPPTYTLDDEEQRNSGYAYQVPTPSQQPSGPPSSSRTHWAGVLPSSHESGPASLSPAPQHRAALPPGVGASDDIDSSSSTTAMPSPSSGPQPGSGGSTLESPGSENELPTIRPTGIYVGDGEGQEYVRLDDPQLTADGVEHQELNDAVTYRSPRTSAEVDGGVQVG